jgi:hypothetical protein
MLNQSTPTGNGENLFIPHFKQVMASFASSIKGLADETMRRNYASLVLDRFLVLFFLQHHGLLDNNIRYLQRHLDMMHTEKADTFYTALFLPLCHTILSGQATSGAPHPAFGHIPTLAYPLFQKHPIEASYQPQIPDESLYNLFLFLEEYRWELIPGAHVPETHVGAVQTCGTRHTGYSACPVVHHDIFADLLEQRINQKQTGTYYTTDDVTGYIANTTILSVLFHRLQKRCPAVIGPDGAIWQRLMHAPDRYIPNVLQHAAYLPRETTREYQLRQQRFHYLITLLQQGKIRTVDAMVTYNLNILRFAVDVISTHQDLELLVTLFAELEQLTILDPNCGSGAFLCTALATLQTLYMACLQRMQELVGRDSRVGTVGADRACPSPVPRADPVQTCGTRHTGYDVDPPPATSSTTDVPLSTTGAEDALVRVDAILKQISTAPNMPYFVVQHVITHNLYGVDLMDEAIRVCTLRLYLTLLAQTQRIEDVSPLSQIPMHIKTGNALVGDVYATIFPEVTQLGGFAVILGNPPYIEYSKVRDQYAIDGYEEKSCGNLYAAMLERSLALLHPDESYIGLLLPMSICGGQRFGQLRTLLTQSLAPMWLANFDIFPCRLLGNAFQRLSILLGRHSAYGQALSGPCADLWREALGRREARPLPEDTGQGGHRAQLQRTDLYITRIHRWYPEERPFIIDLLRYTPCCQPHTSLSQLPVFPKLASPLHAEILQKIVTRSNGHTIAMARQGHETPYFVYYQESTNYWVKAVCHIPFYKRNGITMTPPHGRLLFFGDEQTARIIMALMNSSLFYLWFTTYADGFHLAHAVVSTFPCGQELLKDGGMSGAATSPLAPTTSPENAPESNATSVGVGSAQGTIPTAPICSCVEGTDQMGHDVPAMRFRAATVGVVPCADPESLLTKVGARHDPYSADPVPTGSHPLAHMARKLEADLLAHTRLSTRNTQPTGESGGRDRHSIELTEYQVSYSKGIIDEIDRLLAHYYGFTKDELEFIVGYDEKYRMRKVKDNRAK